MELPEQVFSTPSEWKNGWCLGMLQIFFPALKSNYNYHHYRLHDGPAIENMSLSRTGAEAGKT